jgi:DNA polymerase-1
MVQGAAAEFFKTWAVIVRARLPVGASIVLCLHDELLVHAPTSDAHDAAAIVDDALQETAARWPRPELRTDVHFAAETSVIARWSDAK